MTFGHTMRLSSATVGDCLLKTSASEGASARARGAFATSRPRSRSRNLFIRRASLETRKNCCLRCPPSARPDLRQLLRIRCPVCVLVRAALRSLQSLAGANSIIVSMPSVLQRSRLCFLPALSLAGVFQQSPECACYLLCLLCPGLEPKH